MAGAKGGADISAAETEACDDGIQLKTSETGPVASRVEHPISCSSRTSSIDDPPVPLFPPSSAADGPTSGKSVSTSSISYSALH